MNPSITSKPVSEGQKANFAQVLSDAVRKAAGVVVDELSANGVINQDNLQKILGQGDMIVAAVTIKTKEVVTELAENVIGCLKLISGAETLELDPTDGIKTLAQAADVFTGHLDSDFKNYGCNVKGEPTGKTKVAVHEMIKNGNFKQIFGGLGNDLDKLVFQQDQIIQFVQKYRQWLRTEGWATFFPFKVGDEFFVAYVNLYSDGRLRADVYRFSDDDVWDAESRNRVVVPQLAL